ncbi:polysaccharide biosynthesis/export family protein [Desulfobulbus alkaliphilus]|uniref:polysaccharide biosynthesis/export family protein n=1 Tax=Desulfobulbus alkaliphilus TaxID=869814 RepID=UPI0019638BE8|nr:polysaccharide biosynthesis/export family protein [Desulfobulbus alkaliphilus]MBM9538162.1 polysaccharide biosynthesis/export family protein [Desulfobulbus alkaliphilus]
MKAYFKPMLQFSVFMMLLSLFFVVPVPGAQAAESNRDVAVSDETKEQYRMEILGDRAQIPVDPEYVIGYRDILYVEVYGEGSMAVSAGSATVGQPGEAQDFIRGRGTGAEVGTDGRVSLRHIGDVYVVGMTLTQLADYLQRLYRSVYGDPIITTSLVQSNSRQYTVMGQVRGPGVFHLDYPITVVKAIARAGGFTEWANNRVTIIRQVSELVPGEAGDQHLDQGQRFDFDYRDFLRGRNMESNIRLEPGDVIVVH